jgi:hypothetical protein
VGRGNHLAPSHVEGDVTFRGRRHLPVAALAAALVLVSCGPSAEGRAPALPRPTGAEEVVVQVLVTGGFLPPEAAFGMVPAVTVLGDGEVITPAPTIEIYPGPAIAPLQSVGVDVRTVDRLVQRAEDLGLLTGPLDFGRPPVADAPDTVVTITAGGRPHRHVAYALGLSDGTEEEASIGVTDRQAANRRSLRAFVAATQELPPGEMEWEPSEVAVRVLGDYQPDPELPQADVAWPLERRPALSGEGNPCVQVTGPDTAVLLQALAGANARTPWVVDGRRLSLAFRPIVPGQPGCEGS